MAAIDVVQTVCYGVVMSALEVVGVTGNLLILLTLRRNLRTVTYFYLFAMALVDLAALAFWLPHIATSGWNLALPTSAIYFTAYLGFESIAIVFAVNSLITVAITVERFIAVIFPIKAGRIFTIPRAAAIVLACWLLAIAAEIPDINNAFVAEVLDPESNSTMLVKEYRDYKFALWYENYYWTKLMLFYVLPTVTVCVLNVVVLVKFKQLSDKRSRRLAGVVGGGQVERRYREERKLYIMLVCVSLIFLLDNIPMSVFKVLYERLTPRQRYTLPFEVFRALVNTLEVTNASVNFYIFYAFSKDFRSMFLRKISCGKSVRNAVSDAQASKIRALSVTLRHQ